MPQPTVTTYQRFVFDEIRRIGRAWRSQNPGSFPAQVTDDDIAHLFEKIGELAWRRLADDKSMRRILDEIGVNPDDYLEAPPAGQARRGRVRLEGSAVRDDDGAWNALGASLFWAGWGWQHDRERLDRNLRWLKAAGVDYVRVLGSVGGEGWADRAFEPQDPGYDAAIADLTDHVYAHGLRIQWTIFGGSPGTADRGVRSRVVDRFADAAQGREHKIFAYEIANEGWGGHHASALDEQRAHATRLRAQTNVLVTVTAPNEGLAGSACATFVEAADVAVMHYQRDFGDNGPWRPIRQPWGYPGEYEAECHGKLPPAVFNNEPIGPESSVASEDDPLRLVAGFVTTFIAKNAAYVLHAGPGIRGGGAADRSKGRTANFDELPRAAEYSQMFHTARAYVPDGLATWQRHNAQWPTAPFAGFDTAVEEKAIVRAFCATKDAAIIGIVLGIQRPVVVRAKRAMTLRQVHPLTGATLAEGPLAANGTLRVGATVPAVVLVGTHS